MHREYLIHQHWHCEMNFSPQCFNVHRDNSYRQRAQTLQPTRGITFDEVPDDHFMLRKYFKSIRNPVIAPASTNFANYANVPPDITDMLSHNPSRTINQRPHLNYHSRSHSQHYYNNMQQMNELNSYHNICNANFARSRNPPTIVDEISINNHNNQPPLDKIIVLRICNELGNLDCPPPMPMPRCYSITSDGFYKIMFPHYRIMIGQFTDFYTGTTLPVGARVHVLGPSKKDRSKFTVCYNSDRIDIPHHFTQPPPHPHSGHHDFR